MTDILVSEAVNFVLPDGSDSINEASIMSFEDMGDKMLKASMRYEEMIEDLPSSSSHNAQDLIELVRGFLLGFNKAVGCLDRLDRNIRKLICIFGMEFKGVIDRIDDMSEGNMSDPRFVEYSYERNKEESELVVKMTMVLEYISTVHSGM